MSDARQRAEWNHTAQILALTANCHRDPKRRRAFTVDDFHPFAKTKKKKRKTASRKETRRALRAFAE